MPTNQVAGRLRIWADGLEIIHSHAQALMARTAADEIERLIAERDEARRTVCALDADTTEDQIEYAKHRGWDCYKEAKP
jgi:hypothetical protein